MKIDKNNLENFDDIVNRLTGGVFTEPDTNCPNFNLKGMLEYCKSKNIRPSDLTIEEQNLFLIS